jgi:hypothetical protein
MKPDDDAFHKAAFYVSQRKRADWLNDSAAVIAARFTLIAEKPRSVVSWGTWRTPKRRRSVPPGPPTKPGRRP